MNLYPSFSKVPDTNSSCVQICIDVIYSYFTARCTVAEVSHTICGRNNGLTKNEKKSPPEWVALRIRHATPFRGEARVISYAFYFQIKVSIKLKSGILIAALKDIRS